MAKKKTHGEFMIDFYKKGNKNIIILGKYINKQTKILVQCKIDGYKWYVSPDCLLQGTGCPVCAGKVVIPSLNSVAVLRPDLVKYFENPEDAYNITIGSTSKVKLICSDCGKKHIKYMYDLSKHGFNCQECGQYISYPNRMIRSVMKQLYAKVDYLQYEWSKKWTNQQKYDVYFEINNQKYVIEMQGRQHYESGWYQGESLDTIVNRDKNKLRLAIEHGIIPIIIDARRSDSCFIIENIYNSQLADIFDLSTIDWDQCKIDSTKNIIKQICDCYCKNKNMSITSIAKEYNVNRVTVIRYLKIGNKFGWCTYSPEESNKKHKYMVGKKINVFDKQKNFICMYDSVSECAKMLSNIYNTTFTRTGISRACAKNKESYHDFFFEYA